MWNDLAVKKKKTRKLIIYPLIDRLIWFILTLLGKTIGQAFSAMNIVKTRLRNQIKNDFLADYLIVYIEKELAKKLTIDMIIDDLYSMKEQ